MGFGGVPVKHHLGENARKLVKTGAKNALDFSALVHIRGIILPNESQETMIKFSFTARIK